MSQTDLRTVPTVSDARPLLLPARGAVAARHRRLVWAIAATDVAALLVAMLVAMLVRLGLRPIEFEFVLVMLAAPVLLVMVFSGFRLYDLQRLAPAEEFRRLVAGVGVSMAAIMIGSFWSKASLSRLWVGLTWVLTFLAILAARMLWHKRMGTMRADGRLAFPTIVVGGNEEAERLADLLSNSSTGYRFIGLVLPRGEGPGPKGLPMLGRTDELERIVRESGAECVFVASTALRPEEMKHVLRVARVHGVEMRVSANLAEILATRLTVQPVAGSMALCLQPARLTRGQAVLKRAFDLSVATLALIVTAPIWLVIVIGIKATSRGPVLFRQTRSGRDTRPFTLLKFRTMVAGAEAMVDHLRPANEASGPLFKVRDDPRITRFGRRLRRWSLDELPQLLNVIRGEMSIVGPRPPLPDEVALYDDWHLQRLEVAPGITGLWQVSGRSDLSFDEYVRLDLFYIENWSLAYDLFICVKTLPALLSARGAY